MDVHSPVERLNMELQKTYCSITELLPPEDVNRKYHDEAYGFPIDGDDELFGRLILEINQAGLSWATILKKEQNFRNAYDGFSIKKIAGYTEKDVERLLQNPGIIRNKLKINAAISNAKVIVDLQKLYGSFQEWLAFHHPKTKMEWVKIFKQHFTFTGGEIVNEFLMSSGYLPGAHVKDCPVYKTVEMTNPPWMTTK